MKIEKDFIETKRLSLRKAKIEDYKLLYKNFWSDEKGWKFMLWRPIKNLTSAKEKVKEIVEKQKTSPRFVVVQKNDEPIGIASIILRDDGSVKDFAVGIGSNFTGKGYGYEISKALIKYSFEILNQDEIFGACMTEDKHTHKLLKKLGYREIGISPKSYTRNWDGLAYQKIKFSMTRDEYLKRERKEHRFLWLFKKKKV